MADPSRINLDHQVLNILERITVSLDSLEQRARSNVTDHNIPIDRALNFSSHQQPGTNGTIIIPPTRPLIWTPFSVPPPPLHPPRSTMDQVPSTLQPPPRIGTYYRRRESRSPPRQRLDEDTRSRRRSPLAMKNTRTYTATNRRNYSSRVRQHNEGNSSRTVTFERNLNHGTSSRGNQTVNRQPSRSSPFYQHRSRSTHGPSRPKRLRGKATSTDRQHITSENTDFAPLIHATLKYSLYF